MSWPTDYRRAHLADADRDVSHRQLAATLAEILAEVRSNRPQSRFDRVRECGPHTCPPCHGACTRDVTHSHNPFF